MAKLKLVVAGLVHDHVWGLLADFARTGEVEIAGGADPNRPLLEKLGTTHGVARLYRDYRDLFADVRADAVLVCASNAGGAPIVAAAAARGLDALVEKPLAATAAQARAMAAAARRHRTRLMVNWPLAWNPATARALEIARSGDLGRVFHVRAHMAHQGPKEAGCSPYFYRWLYDAKENGGGAIIDYCCYGAAIFAALWGRPRQVFGVARTLVKRRFPVDDNAMVTAIYGERICVAQASWTQNPDFHDCLFLGEKGTLQTDRGRLIRTHTNPKDFAHWGADRLNRREIPLAPMPRGRRSGPEHFIRCLKRDEPFDPLCSADTGVIAQEILSAGVESERTGRRVDLRRG
jgi:predicted dehydrogenase